MIIRKYDDYFLVKIFKDNIGDFNIFDMEDIKDFFQSIFDKLKNNYELSGLIEADVYIDNNYGMIVEFRPVCDYFDEVEMRITMHLSNVFLIEIDINNLLDYEDVYYYKGKFYGTYLGICDNEVFYKNTEDIINKGIKVC